MLGWFKAYYELDKPEVVVQAAPAQPRKKFTRRKPMPAAESDSDGDSDAGNGRSRAIRVDRGEEAASERKKNEELSKNLNDHNATIQLFKGILLETWPEDDVVKDRMSSFEDDVDEVLEEVEYPGSNKRKLADEAQPAPKRAKTMA